MSRKLAILLKGYPRLSETFIAQEILALQKAGIEIEIVSLRHPTDQRIHPVHREITAPVRYLPEYLHQDPIRLLKAWWRARRLPGYSLARKAFFKDLQRDFTRNRIRRFGQALVLAAELSDKTAWLYAHFLHTPGSVARYCAKLRGLNWSVSAHARDIWTIPDWEKSEKLEDMAWLTTCTASGLEHLRSLTRHPEKLHLIYHGVDRDRFPEPTAAHDHRGGSPDQAVEILSVGRCVVKKGYEDLLQALSLLPGGLHWRFVHIGGGELSKTLQEKAKALGLDQRIEWRGAQAQEEVVAAYRRADLFVLASRIAGDGDRDGLPNVLMEAQTQALCCLSTNLSAIPELIEDRRTGWLVPPEDPKALAAALARLIVDPTLREKLGKAGYHRVTEAFAFSNTIGELLDLFKATTGLPEEGRKPIGTAAE